MILPGHLKAKLNDLLHFKAPGSSTIPERAVKEQQALHDLGHSQHFAALLDNFEGLIRSQFREFVDTDDWETAQEMWREARSTQILLTRLMEAVGAKQRGEELEALAKRQVDLMRADQERFNTAFDLAQQRGSTPSYD